MKIAVIGAGIIGVTTAYELSADGHEVTVFERRGSVAAETSFANAGVIAPGYVTPWAAPGMPAKVLGQMLRQHAPVRIRGLPLRRIAVDVALVARLQLRTYQANRLRMQRLAHFSRERLHKLTSDLKLEYERSDGYLVLLRSAKDLALVQPGLASLAELETRFETLDPSQCRAVEPGLNLETELHAGSLPARRRGRQLPPVQPPAAQRGAAPGCAVPVSTRLWRRSSAARRHSSCMCTRRRRSTAARPSAPRAHRTMRRTRSRWRCSRSPKASMPVVVCAALGSAALLRPLGLKLPLQAGARLLDHRAAAPP